MTAILVGKNARLRGIEANLQRPNEKATIDCNGCADCALSKELRARGPVKSIAAILQQNDKTVSVFEILHCQSANDVATCRRGVTSIVKIRRSIGAGWCVEITCSRNHRHVI
ncbi:hypothetical protein [Sphingomonas sp. Leaf242]|uniref:hypothetical protein n=1 Tax=Sphingomonas sp. Leaf242 TaxID=1736304 RepID=UPI0012E293A7|nr:hypothetical protein [Sphingomonas sp. Leaf242]